MNLIPYLFAVLKNVIYGSTVFFTGTLSNTVDVLDILSLRFLLSFAVFFILKQCRVLKISVGLRDVFGKTERSKFVPSLLLAALFEPVLYMLFETLGITMSTGVTTAVILSLAPISSCICEALILKERTSLLQKLFLGLGIVGVIYIAVNTNTSDGKNSLWGILFLLLAVCTGSLYSAFSRKSSKAFASMEITYVSAALGALVFNTVNVVRHLTKGDILHYFDPFLSVQNLIGFGVLAILSTIVATAMNNYALGRIQVSTMAAFGGLSTLVTVLIGVFIGGEELYYFHYIGFALILARMIGVSVLTIRRDKKRKQENDQA